MPRDAEEVLNLKARIRELERENEELKKRLDRARGVPAEVLVAQLTGGKLTGYKDSYDVMTKNGNRVEVKLSKVNVPKCTNTRRWNWDRILGTKKYDYLVLAGEKDDPHCQQYPGDLVYVFFSVPQSAVEDISSRGDCVALNTNFTKARARKARILIEQYLVTSQERFKDL